MLGEDLNEADFERFRQLIYRLAGIRIPPSKRLMISNRLRRRLRETGIATFPAYYAHLGSPSGTAEVAPFLDAITTNETYFFRDTQHYDWLGGTFLPQVVAEARAGGRPKKLRIWSAACSTGEEPYSMALRIHALRSQLSGWDLSILGTDLSGAALAAARAARYGARALRLVSDEDRRLHFDADPDGLHWTPKPEVRDLVRWKRHNLMQPLNHESFDCIFVKNVLIYFDPDSKQTVVRHLLAALRPGGYLVVGPTEGIYNLLGDLAKLQNGLYRRPA